MYTRLLESHLCLLSCMQFQQNTVEYLQRLLTVRSDCIRIQVLKLIYKFELSVFLDYVQTNVFSNSPQIQRGALECLYSLYRFVSSEFVIRLRNLHVLGGNYAEYYQFVKLWGEQSEECGALVQEIVEGGDGVPVIHEGDW